jgi:hypothetical protein
MSLQSALVQIQSLAPKAPGHLIRAQDWNALIGALGEVGAELSAQAESVASLVTTTATLDARVSAVEESTQTLLSELGNLTQRVQPLLENYRITLACDRQTYASGELCEIRVTVTDLVGRALPAPFPWVDLVAAWGRLRAKAGVITRAGAGDNALSVQVNAAGLATVELRAEHAEGFSEAEESDVRAVLETRVPETSVSVAQAFLATPNPIDPISKSAFKLLHDVYDTAGPTAFRSYADTYHVRTPEYTLRPVGGNVTARWSESRATVIALAKPDADPTTPDGARAAGSLQVTFRDWLGPWIVDYYDDIGTLQAQVGSEYTALFQQPGVADLIASRVNGALNTRGIIGRKKYLGAASKAIELINPGTDPGRQATQAQLSQGLAAQRSNEIYASAAPNAGAPLLAAHLGLGKATEAVSVEVKQVSAGLEKTRQLEVSVGVLEGRLQSTEQVGSQIQSSLTLINDNVRAINPLDANSLKSSVNKISADIAQLRANFG